MKNNNTTLKQLACRVAAGMALLAGAALNTYGVDYHVATAQDLQNALTSSAADGADDYIYLAAGYYTGNFNFNSAENYSLTIQGEPGTTNTAITIDGAATGRDVNLANTGTGNFTIRGVTFLRNTGNGSYGSLRIAGGTGSTLLVEACRLLSPTNASATGTGLEITSGQNAIITNCMVIGKTSYDYAYGILIQGVSGSISVGNCSINTNYGGALGITGGATVSLVANNFIGNNSGVSATGGGSLTFLNNNVFKNSALGANLSASSLALVAGNIFTANLPGSGYVGGCSVSAATTIVSNNVFANNVGRSYYQSGDGVGGASVSGTTVTVVGNTFNGNSGYNGGALSCGGNATIIGNSFIGNSAISGNNPGRGGGLYCGAATVISNLFSANSASSSGGGLFCSGASTIVANTFIGNSGGGAALSFSTGSSTISANSFKQNSGGGISASGATIFITDNLVAKNTAGSAISASPTVLLNMVNNTVTDNTTTGNGGGLSVSVSGTSEILNVYNNIIWGNSASGNGADVWLAGTGSKKSFINNDVDGMYGVWDITANLIDAAPAYFDPVNGDYHLRSTSACINAGTNGAPSIPPYDLDGNNRTNAAIVDLGCYEFNNTAFHPADTNQDWKLTPAEYANYAAAWKNSQSWPTGPAQVPADFVTRAGYIQNISTNYHNDGAGAPLGWKTGP